MSWNAKAKCLPYEQEAFFENIFGPELESEPNLEALEAARSICDSCPVRRQCFAAALIDDDGRKSELRFGLRAGMTPAQRWSAEHRKTTVCSGCGCTLDPNSVRAGEIICPEDCGAPDRTVPVMVDGGDKWTRRHTTLARKVVRWLVESVEAGEVITLPSPLARSWGDRVNDMTRVYTALVTDGTLTRDEDGAYHRGITVGAWSSWVPAHLVVEQLPLQAAGVA